MSDLIERQAALCPKFTLSVGRFNRKTAKIVTEVMNGYSEYLAGLPSAQPERGEGRWIIQDHPATGWFRVLCSECGEDVTSNAPIIGFFPNAKCIWDFCPWCGAKMGGEQE